MTRFRSLLLREWMQHRFAWALMVLIPIVIAMLASGLGQVHLDSDSPTMQRFPLLVTSASIVGTAFGLTVIATIASLVTVIGLARRDHGDRSNEFWLSLPIDHASAFAAPLLVHLLLVPAAALLAGWASGLLISLVLTTRVAGFGEWIALPWGAVLSATLAGVLRVIAGLPLAMLWLSPLILILVLLCAWFRRWGLVIFAVALLAGALAATQHFGRPLPAETVLDLLRHAAQALIFPDRGGFTVRSGADVDLALSMVPAWAVENFGHSVAQLASPLLLGGLVVAGACFAGLMDWRRRGAASS